jgi:acyl-coenzyme A synthetase/AMP-(fatty) acid ligase
VPLWRVGPESVIFCFSKLFFAYGICSSMFLPLSAGASAVLASKRLGPVETFETIARHRPTHFYCVPTFYNAMLQVPDAERAYDLRSLRSCASAGEALPPPLYEAWLRRFGTEILDLWGMSDTLYLAFVNRPGEARPGSSGRLIPGIEARIVDEHGDDLPDGEEGQLLVKSGSNTTGYWNKREKTRETVRGEWLVTGDLYRRDADGYYWFSGRSDDLFKVGALWVSPVEVEAVLLFHPAVFECAVVGHTDERDQLVKARAVVVLKEGFGASACSDIEAHCHAHLPRYKAPAVIDVVASLPKTATGKIQRFLLRD